MSADVIATGSVQIEELLLALKIGFLVLLYLFIWRIVRAARREVSLPQDSMLLTPDQAKELRAQAGVGAGKVVLVKGPGHLEGMEYTLDSGPITVGRDSSNDVVVKNDEFASATHARIEPRGNGVWLEDLGSTNGTYLNGIRLKKPKRLEAGDEIMVGETELRFER